MSENRFKLARTKYNQHGEETVKEVAAHLEIPKSLLDDLESEAGKKRGTSYLTVKRIAEYYGVSSDYLLGLSDFPKVNHDVSRIGLSNDALLNLWSDSDRVPPFMEGRRALISAILEIPDEELMRVSQEFYKAKDLAENHSYEKVAMYPITRMQKVLNDITLDVTDLIGFHIRNCFDNIQEWVASNMCIRWMDNTDDEGEEE